MAREHVDPKSAGLGADLLSSIDLVAKSHNAVREVLLALEKVSPPGAPGGAPAGAAGDVDDLRSKAQLARRALETLDADLSTLKISLASSSAPGQVTGNGAAPHVHVHLHLELPQPIGQPRVQQ